MAQECKKHTEQFVSGQCRLALGVSCSDGVSNSHHSMTMVLGAPGTLYRTGSSHRRWPACSAGCQKWRAGSGLWRAGRRRERRWRLDQSRAGCPTRTWGLHQKCQDLLIRSKGARPLGSGCALQHYMMWMLALMSLHDQYLCALCMKKYIPKLQHLSVKRSLR